MKIKLRQDAVVYLRDGITIRNAIVSEKDIIFDIEETYSNAAYTTRWYNYVRPWPVYDGLNVKSIEWSINDINEEVILD